MTRRATALSQQDRRRELVDVTIRLVRRHHAVPSTRDVAQEAGIAEGTMFRAFETKDALVEAVIGAVACPVPLRTALRGVDRELPLARRTECAAHLLMERFAGLFEVLGPLGVLGPPPHHEHPGCPDPGARIPPSEPGQRTALTELFEQDAPVLRLTPPEFAHALRLLCFGGTARHVSDGRPLTPQTVTELLLHGALRHDVRVNPIGKESQC